MPARYVRSCFKSDLGESDPLQEAHAEIERLRAALQPFAEWNEADETTHWFLSDPAVWAAAKAAYEQEVRK